MKNNSKNETLHQNYNQILTNYNQNLDYSTIITSYNYKIDLESKRASQ